MSELTETIRSAAAVGYWREERVPQVIALKVARGSMRNNCYLVADFASGAAIVVDPAWQSDVVEQALGRIGATLRGVLVTHSHPDHIDLAAPLSRRHGCPIWMSAEEIAWSGFDAERVVATGDTPWRVGSMLIRPILTPGHTPGCVCYWIGDALFTGDVLFAEGCGLCPDVAAAHAMFWSLERLKAVVTPATRVFPGHTYAKAPGQSFGRILEDNIYLQFPTKEMFAAYRLRGGQDRRKMFEFK